MMNFKQYITEGVVDNETIHKIWLKATTPGIPGHRGIKEFRKNLPYSNDPGDFGRGIYYTTSKARAKAYGKTFSTVIKFNNPLVLSVNQAYDLADNYGTIANMRNGKEALNGAETMTKTMLSKGYDGLIAINRNLLMKKDSEGYYFRSHISDFGELEIVDYRPYKINQ